MSTAFLCLGGQWTPPEVELRKKLASEIASLGLDIIDVRGEDIENKRSVGSGTSFDFEREPDTYLCRYAEHGIEIKHTGPDTSEKERAGWSHCFFVYWHGLMLVRLIDTTPSVLECDIDTAQEALKVLRKIWEECQRRHDS